MHIHEFKFNTESIFVDSRVCNLQFQEISTISDFRKLLQNEDSESTQQKKQIGICVVDSESLKIDSKHFLRVYKDN